MHAQLSSDQPAQWYTHCDWRGSGALETVSMDGRGSRAPSVPMITALSDADSALRHSLSFLHASEGGALALPNSARASRDDLPAWLICYPILIGPAPCLLTLGVRDSYSVESTVEGTKAWIMHSIDRTAEVSEG